jgi:2-polyprenyl-3-methyl-5-hydroxy-6-metoxy-1,4-benzoquinol methylase
VPDYVLPHSLSGEHARLILMAELLDPFHRQQILALGIKPGWRCLEVGAGIGSISRWLAECVGPAGHVVVSDIDLTYIRDLKLPNVEVRRLDVLHDATEAAAYDLVTARALLHHLAEPKTAIEHMLAALKPTGHLLLIEPDMLPATVTEPETVHAFWRGWLQWSVSQGIDYSIGRKLPSMLAALGCAAITGQGQTVFHSGASPWAEYWRSTVSELRDSLLQSGYVSEVELAAFESAYSDPNYWTAAISFVASSGRPHLAAAASVVQPKPS